MLSAGLQTQKGRTFCSSRFDVHFVETRTLYSPDEGILLTHVMTGVC